MEKFKVEYKTTTIKEYNASDLPIYKVWDSGLSEWYYRCRILDGRLKCDVIKMSNNMDSITYDTTTLSCVFNEYNIKVDEDAWRNAMHRLINHIRI